MFARRGYIANFSRWWRVIGKHLRNACRLQRSACSDPLNVCRILRRRNYIPRHTGHKLLFCARHPGQLTLRQDGKRQHTPDPVRCNLPFFWDPFLRCMQMHIEGRLRRIRYKLEDIPFLFCLTFYLLVIYKKPINTVGRFVLAVCALSNKEPTCKRAGFQAVNNPRLCW